MIEKADLAKRGQISCAELYRCEPVPSGKHEFLFFIKPEIMEPGAPVKTEAVLDLIFSKIAESGLQIAALKILGADYLEKYNIIARHYGVINKLATDPLPNLSDAAKAAFETNFGKRIESCTVLGGVECMNRFSFFNPYSFDVLWQNTPYKKLAGGTYCGPVSIDGEQIYLVNGFHPKQLVHFTEKGRSIFVFTLVGDLSWSDARSKFLGATDPSKALSGSIRKTLLEKADEFRLKAVVPSLNGAHLSAGPVEGLVELMRYNSDFASGTLKSINDFSFGRMLASSFTKESVEKIISNEDLIIDGRRISVFDLTEEKNADEAVALLKKAGL
jgi:nucleoside diphosphate kinase